MRKQSLEFLKKLLSTPSPSGFESNIQRLWCQYARKYADEVHTDAYGNAVAVLNPKGNPKLMLDGHIDELGLMVKHIGYIPRHDDGYIYFQKIGGVDPALLRGKRVIIHNAKGKVPGVVGAAAIHLQERDKDKKVPKIHEVYIDIGVGSRKEAEKKVAVGDPITFTDDFEMINEHVAVARAFDNRVGSFAVIEALRIAAQSKRKPRCAIYACSSVMEELGLIGATMSVMNVKPDMAVAVDVTHATDTPDVNFKEHGEINLGGGPTVSLGRENHPVLVDRLRKLSKTKKIPLQIETFSTTGGTDALAIFNKLGGIPSAIMGIPNRYMHTTVEMIDLRDIERAAELCHALALSVKKGERFKVSV